jgi:hypothetical protein
LLFCPAKGKHFRLPKRMIPPTAPRFGASMALKHNATRIQLQ